MRLNCSRLGHQYVQMIKLLLQATKMSLGQRLLHMPLNRPRLRKLLSNQTFPNVDGTMSYYILIQLSMAFVSGFSYLGYIFSLCTICSATYIVNIGVKGGSQRIKWIAMNNVDINV